MKMLRHFRGMALVAILISLPQATPALARNNAAYSSSMPTTYRRAYAHWRAHLPMAYRRVAWASRFRGDAKPIRSVTLLGRSMLFFETCASHGCTRNEADAVVAPDGATAFGVILDNGDPIAVGKVSHAEMACLRAFAESYRQTSC